MSAHTSNEQVMTVVCDTLQRVLTRRNHTAVHCTPESNLVSDLGFESLDLAEIVALLELHFGFDPFTDQIAITDVHTVQDLCDAYSSYEIPGPGLPR